MLYGGGLQMGKVIGASARDGGTPADNPVSMQNLLATVMHTLLDLGEVRVMDGLPKSLVDTLTGSEPIKGLV
jgi:hypothetical protein